MIVSHHPRSNSTKKNPKIHVLLSILPEDYDLLRRGEPLVGEINGHRYTVSLNVKKTEIPKVVEKPAPAPPAKESLVCI